MHFDTVLNVVWLLLGGVLVITPHLFRRRLFANSLFPGSLHLFGVAFIVAALFPYISASDDILRIEHSQMQQDHENGDQRSSDDLLRLYETLDSPLVTSCCGIVFTLVFISLVILLVQKLVRSTTSLEAGRSPPLLSLAQFS